mmetsp:Transcript_3749/g.9721  ORF Transcript_3749/g.9721 Transcript_3749/m.9721 type:complete len:171 (-) Transcript_3749:431-943(-)
MPHDIWGGYPAEGSQAHWRPASMGGLAQVPARGVDDNDSSSRHAVRKCTVHSDPPTPAVNGSHQRAPQLSVDSAYAKKRDKAAWLSDDCLAILPRKRTPTLASILPRQCPVLLSAAYQMRLDFARSDASCWHTDWNVTMARTRAYASLHAERNAIISTSSGSDTLYSEVF